MIHDAAINGRQRSQTLALDNRKLPEGRQPIASGQIVHLGARSQAMADTRGSTQSAQKEILIEKELVGAFHISSCDAGARAFGKGIDVCIVMRYAEERLGAETLGQHWFSATVRVSIPKIVGLIARPLLSTGVTLHLAPIAPALRGDRFAPQLRTHAMHPTLIARLARRLAQPSQVEA
jgi:hypothetical protein